MSEFDRLLEEELEKQKKKKKQTVTPSKTLGNSLSYLPSYNKLTASDIAPVLLTTRTEENDFAPIKTKTDDNGLDFFQKGSFSDGYQFGDITKTILGTVGDVGLNALKGVAGVGEGVGDLISYGIAGVGDLLGKDEWADDVRGRAKESVIDSLTKGADDYLNQYSVLGRTSDSIAQGIGQVGAIMATGGIGAAAGLGTGGVTALTTGMMGLSGMGSGMGEAYKGGATDEEALTYGAISGAADALTELLFGGLGKAVNAVGLSRGLSSADDLLAKKVSNLFKSQIAKNVAEFGIKAGAEGFEEVLAGIAQGIGKHITYADDKELSEIMKDENLLEQFIVGAVTSGIAQAPGLNIANKTKTDFVTGQTQQEQDVLKKVVEDRIAELEKEGKTLTNKQKGEIEADVLSDMEKGYISTETIEEVLGGDNYTAYQDTIKQENDALAELAELYEGEELQQRAQEFMDNSKRSEMAKTLSDSVYDMVKDTRLGESYRDRARRGQLFQADVSKYDEKQRVTIQRAIDSGVLNNTNRTHDMVDFIAKVSADTGVLFDFTSNEKLKDSIFAVNGKTVDGYITKDGITINVNSPRYINTIVGHEITHAFEGSEQYEVLEKALFEYAKEKGNYKEVLKDAYDMYSGEEGYQGYEGLKKIKKEAVANLVGEYLFTDKNFVNHLSAKHQNIFQKVWNEVKYMVKIARAGSNEAKKLLEVQKAFEDAYRVANTKENATVDSGVKLGISKTSKIPYGNQLEQIENGKMNGSNSLYIGKPSDQLQTVGFSDAPFAMNQSDYRKSRRASGNNKHYSSHAVPYTFFENMPQHLADAPMVIDNGGKASVITSFGMKDTKGNDSYVIAGVWTNQQMESDTVNLVKSAYPLDDIAQRITKAAEDGKLVVTNKNKAEQMLATIGIQPSEVSRILNLAKGSISQQEGTVNRKYSLSKDSEGNQLTKEQQEFFKDSKAVDSKGNLLKVYHTTNSDFTVFDKSKKGETTGDYNTYLGFFFADTPEYMNQFPEFKNGKTETYYLNMKNPIDMNNISKQAFLDIVEATGGDVQEAAELYDREYKDEIQRAKFRGDNSTIMEMSRLLEELTGDYFDYAEFYNALKPNYEKLMAKGYDGVINSLDGRGFANEYIVLDSNQAKLTSNTKPTADPDIRYSLSKDSEGRNLSENQAKYFKGSKVTDERGNLKVVYHGSPKDFNTFSLEYLGTNGTAEGYGFYFTDKKSIAENYSRGYEGQQNGKPGKLFECYLDIKKPLSDTEVTMTRAQFKKFLTTLNEQVDADGEPLDVLSNYGDVDWEGVNKVLSYAMEIEYDGSDSDVNLVHSIINGCGNMEVVLDVLRKTLGYDGIIVNEATWGGDQTIYIAFHPEQIKNVDNLSPTTDPDIRYSLSKETEYADPFYSHMAKVVDGVKQDKLGASSVVNMLRGKGVKAEEIKWSGIEEFLSGKKSVTKAELQEFVKGSMLQIEETVLDDGANSGISYTEDEQHDLQAMSDWLSRRMDQARELWQEAYGEEMPMAVLFANNTATAITREIIDRNGGIRGFRGVDAMSDAERTLYTEVTDGIRRLDLQIADIRERAEARQKNTSQTHWGQYRLEGGDNYREYLFKMPGSNYRNQAMDVHWKGETGVLAHARVQDYETAQGKMLFIEEIQSDWHNAGQKNGYTSETTLARIRELEDQIAQIDSKTNAIDKEYDAFLTRYWEEDLTDEEYTQTVRGFQEAKTELSYKRKDIRKELNTLTESLGVPDAPFKNNYQEYVLKRLIRMAAEQGYDSIGWTTADIQSDRWSGDFAEGYRIEYDQDIPKFLKKYGKQWGAQVEKTDIQTKQLSQNEEINLYFYADILEDGEAYIRDKKGVKEVWIMPITDAMKQSVLYEGQPMYSLSNDDTHPIKQGNWHISGKDIAYEDIAPVAETKPQTKPPVSQTKVVADEPAEELFPDDLGSAQYEAESFDSIDDADAPPEMDTAHDEFADTTPLNKKTVTDLSKKVKNLLGIKNNRTGEVVSMIEAYSRSEDRSTEKLFEELKDKFGKYTEKYVDEPTKELKALLRGYRINVSDSIKSEIADYADLMRRNFGRVRFSKEGMNVDEVYEDLHASYPGYFPESIINPTDQLLRIIDVANLEAEAVVDMEVDDESLADAARTIARTVRAYQQSQMQDLSNREGREAFNSLMESADKFVPADDIAPVVKQKEKTAKIEKPAEIAPEGKIKTVKERLTAKMQNLEAELESNRRLREESWSDYDSEIARAQAEYNAKSNKNTVAANDLLRRIERLNRMKHNTDADYAKRISDLEARTAKVAEEVRTGQSASEQGAMRQELHNRILSNIRSRFEEKGFDFDDVLRKAKNLSTFATVDNTPQRVMEKALGYKQGQVLSDLTVNKVAQNETEGIKWLNTFTDRKNGVLAKLSKQYHIKPGSKESAAAQMYAEGFYVNDKNEIVQYGDAELAQDFPNATVRQNIKGLARDPRIRQIYDGTLAKINESRARNAYPEIQRLDNYFLHFRAMDDTFSKLGIPFNPNDIKAKDLPTDLNGVTADLKPGQPYFASAMHRTGKRTSFDLLGGLERYLSSAKNQIYHIDDIQTLRALRNYVADTYGQAHGLESLDLLTEEEAQERIEKVYGSHLSTFAKFLNEEANVIAGKTALIDRGLEGIIGRRGITFLDTVNRQVGSNMVGFNVSSSLTNFLPVAQTLAKTNKFDFLKAFAQTVSNKVGSVFGRGDSFTEESSVFIRRKGEERFYRTPWQKAGDAGYMLMGAVDDISTELIARTKYNELTRKGMDSKQAHYETDKWVSRLMGDRSLGQQPQLYNSKMLGMITKFQLEVRNQLDAQFYDTIQEEKVSNEYIQNGLLRNAKTAAKVGSTFFQLAVAQHLFGKAFESVAGYNPAFDIISVLIKAFGWDDDDESEDTVLDNIEEGFLELLGDLPYTSTLTGGRIPISSALPVQQFVTGKDQYGNETSRWETLASAAPYYVLPGGYGQAKKTYQGLSMFDDDLPVSGSYTDSGNLRFPVEDTIGNRVQAGLFGQYASQNARDYFDNKRSPLKPKQIQEYIDVDLPIADYWKYREGLSEHPTLDAKGDYIGGLDLPVSKKNILINNIAQREEPINMADYDKYPNFHEFDWAEQNEKKYAFLQEHGMSYSDYEKLDEDSKKAYTWAYNNPERYEFVKGQGLSATEYYSLDDDTKDAYGWAYDNPEMYTVSKAVSNDFLTYYQYKTDLSKLNAKNENGESVSGLKKERVIDYINGLDIDYGQKIILFRSMYDSKADKADYNADIVDYLNSRDDLSYEEIVTILKKLDFTVSEDGTVTW